MIRAVLPDHIAARLNVDELELNGLAGWQRDIQEPVGIVGVKHGTNCGLKCRAPVTEFDGAAGDKNVIARIRRRGIVHREGHGDELCRKYREGYGIGGVSVGCF